MIVTALSGHKDSVMHTKEFIVPVKCIIINAYLKFLIARNIHANTGVCIKRNYLWGRGNMT